MFNIKLLTKQRGSFFDWMTSLEYFISEKIVTKFPSNTKFLFSAYFCLGVILEIVLEQKPHAFFSTYILKG